MQLDTFKLKFISQLKSLYSAFIIYPQYSIYDQLNAGIAGGDPTMESWIAGKKADIQAIEDDINALADTAILDNYVSDWDQSTAYTHIESYLASCNTDERRYITRCALNGAKSL